MNFLILSHHKPTYDYTLALWWAPNRAGYTVNVDKAGRYGKREAEAICKGGQASMVPVPDVKKITRKVVVYGDIDYRIRPAKRAP